MPDTADHTIPSTDPTAQDQLTLYRGEAKDGIYITEEGFAVFIENHHCALIELIHEAENREVRP